MREKKSALMMMTFLKLWGAGKKDQARRTCTNVVVFWIRRKVLLFNQFFSLEIQSEEALIRCMQKRCLWPREQWSGSDRGCAPVECEHASQNTALRTMESLESH